MATVQSTPPAAPMLEAALPCSKALSELDARLNAIKIKRRSMYQNDPEFRERQKAASRKYAARRRELQRQAETTNPDERIERRGRPRKVYAISPPPQEPDAGEPDGVKV